MRLGSFCCALGVNRLARHPEIYRTAEWRKVRAHVIARANGLCEECKRKGKVKKGRDVDHIVELTDENKHRWEIAYNPENLQFLCDCCHQHKHNRSNGLQEFVNPPTTTEGNG